MAGLAAARMSGGSEFHTAGPACEKERSPNLVRSRGVTYLLLEADRRPVHVAALLDVRTMSARYAGHLPVCIPYVIVHSLKLIRQPVQYQQAWREVVANVQLVDEMCCSVDIVREASLHAGFLGVCRVNCKGTGKTLVAVMLMSRLLTLNPHHSVVFVVDRILLALQQNKVIKKELGDRMFDR